MGGLDHCTDSDDYSDAHLSDKGAEPPTPKVMTALEERGTSVRSRFLIQREISASPLQEQSINTVPGTF